VGKIAARAAKSGSAAKSLIKLSESAEASPTARVENMEGGTTDIASATQVAGEYWCIA
jgi:hypothetical protein